MHRPSNLQNRSFRGQDLSGADFSGANLRGCNFTGAILRGANFQRVELGRSRRQWLEMSLAIAIGFLITAHGVTRLIFPALGQPLAGTSGLLVIVLHLVLMAAGLGILARSRSPQLAVTLGGCLSGLLVGFFYGGSAFGEALLPASLTAVVGAGSSGWLSQRWPQSGGAIVLITASVVMSSGATFLLGTSAIAGLAGQHWVGILLSGLTLIYLWLTWRWSLYLGDRIETFGGTSFRNADLTGAKFEPITAGRVCFEGAIAAARSR